MRHNSGMAPSQNRGRLQGQSSKSSQVRALLASGMTVAEIARKVGCTANLVYVVKASAKAGGGAKKRGHGRPPKARPVATDLDGIAGILEAVQNSDRERAQLRGALEKIQALVADVLAS